MSQYVWGNCYWFSQTPYTKSPEKVDVRQTLDGEKDNRLKEHEQQQWQMRQCCCCWVKNSEPFNAHHTHWMSCVCNFNVPHAAKNVNKSATRQFSQGQERGACWFYGEDQMCQWCDALEAQLVERASRVREAVSFAARPSPSLSTISCPILQLSSSPLSLQPILPPVKSKCFHATAAKCSLMGKCSQLFSCINWK